MLKVIEVAFTGYPTTDMKRARAFYEGVLNLTPASVFDHDGKSWVEYEIGPAVVAISDMQPDWKPGTEGGGVALEVEDFDASIRWLKEKNVTFIYDAMESPVCHMAIIADPDGNSLVIHKRKPGHH
jgi:predicted enzyme related to lactoylglutathione lyase